MTNCPGLQFSFLPSCYLVKCRCFQAFSVRNVVQNEMQRLNDLKERVLYKITMLEVLLPPLNRRLNQSLSHLKTIQFFLDNQAWELSEMVINFCRYNLVLANRFPVRALWAEIKGNWWLKG